ncbi:MAG: tetratricopeptide repeat protein [Acidobacteriota bacterium]
MKTSERQHLKVNEVALATEWLITRFNEKRGLWSAVIGIVLVVVLGVGGYSAWRANIDSQAEALLSQAMVIYDARVAPPVPAVNASPNSPAVTQQPGTYPTERAKLEAALPKFQAVADAYPTSTAGLTARYLMASVLVGLGRYDEAVEQYDRVISAGRGMVSRVARLGKAEAELRAGRHDAAIAGFKAVVEAPAGDLPPEAVKLELARAYRLAGRLDEARQTLTDITENHADSPFAAEARAELERIKS